MISVLRQRNFALLWTAGLLSLLGDWAFYTIMPVFVLDRTGSVFLAGSVWAVIALPSVVIGPFAGVYADRWDRRRILLVGNGLQSIAALVLATGGTAVGIWLAMVVLLLNASLAAILLPAENALLPALVSSDELVPANALNAMNDNLGRIAGPPVGALVYARLGIDAVALFNAVSFLAATLLVWQVQQVRREREDRDVLRYDRGGGVGGESFWRSLRTGVEVVCGRRLLGVLFLIFGVIAFADGPLAAMIPPFADTTLGKGAEGVGLLMTFRGVSGLLGALMIGHIAPRVREARLLAVSASLNGLGFVAMALSGNFVVVCAIMLVVIGPTHIGLHTTLTTVLQRATDDAHRGRVFALLGALTGILFLAGTLGGSAMGAYLSPAAVIAVSGSLFLVAASIVLVLLPPAMTTLPGRER
jgi:predicted MFS family arabinose efflux permease